MRNKPLPEGLGTMGFPCMFYFFNQISGPGGLLPSFQ
jgi:hypothetical protein